MLDASLQTSNTTTPSDICLMFPRLLQVTHHLIRRPTISSFSRMSDPFQKSIRTAACLIIGDEVLNGKVCGVRGSERECVVVIDESREVDGRYELPLLRQVLFRPRHRTEANRSRRRRRERNRRGRTSYVGKLRFRRYVGGDRAGLFSLGRPGAELSGRIDARRYYLPLARRCVRLPAGAA